MDISYCSFNNCNKRIHIVNLYCKCGYKYCIKHRLPEMHNCVFNYKNIIQKDKLIESMKCSSIKIQKL
jgi:predicted nucleic acid binding AN1-type Zn finger protein